MKCDNERCISNADGYCEIPEHYVHLDENGVCTNMLLDERNKRHCDGLRYFEFVCV